MSRIESSLRCSAQIKSLPEFVRAEYVAAADRIAELEAERDAAILRSNTLHIENLQLDQALDAATIERDTLRARIAGGVELADCCLQPADDHGPHALVLSFEEYAALLPLNGHAVTVIGGEP